MGIALVSTLLLVVQPVADPTYFSYNSPQCVAHRLAELNPLPLMVRTEHPSCPWTSDDASLVEVGRHLSNYSWWNYERTVNLELAASHIDGTMLLPGEEFSYNETVGERTIEAGFKEAKIITERGYADGIGGGVCQVASNLHAAAMHAGLEIAERWPHRFRVKYMPPGLDATVDYGRKDLKVVNNTPFPVVLELGRLEQGELLARVMAPIRTHRLKFKYEVVKETPSDTVRFKRVEDPSDVVEYYGRPGLEIAKTVWRRNLLTGKLRRLRLPNDEYLPSPWSLRVKALPDGKRVATGVSRSRLNRLLKGSRYRVESARFRDIDRDAGKYLYMSHVTRKKRRVYRRFSTMEKYVKLAGLGCPEPPGM